MVALNYEKIKWNQERVSDIKPFINKYNWKEINNPSKIGDWKTFEKNNPTTAINILYLKEEEPKGKRVQFIFQKLIPIVKNPIVENLLKNPIPIVDH